ncbi:MAG: TetR family transcriptional regulator [Acidimicrobiales bacterium]
MIEAATSSFVERGFHATSVAEVAERASLTTGAVYSNFTGKDDLLLAVIDRQVAQDTKALTLALDSATSIDDVLARVGDWFGSIMRAEWMVLQLELTIHSRSKPELASQLRKRQHALEAGTAQILRAQTERFGVESPMDIDRLAAVVWSFGDGLAVRKLLDSDANTGALFREVLRALTPSSTATSHRRPQQRRSGGNRKDHR